MHHFIPIPALTDNLIWAWLNPSREVWVVDPGDAKPVEAFLAQQHYTLRGIFITHHHADHTNGVTALREHYAVPVYGSTHSPCRDITIHVSDDNPIHVPEWGHVEIISIPGHTLDHIAYYTKDSLFCGDTLFAAGCGRVFEGTYPMMYASLQRLASLPDKTKLYCGHEYTLSNLRFAQHVDPSNQAVLKRIKAVQVLREQGLCSLPSTIGEEKRTNPFLCCHRPSIKAAAEHYAQHLLSDTEDVFTCLRQWKNQFG